MGDGRGERSEADRLGSETLIGSVGTPLSLRRESKRKKPRRLTGTCGEVGLATVVGEAGDIADMGLFRLNMSLLKCGLLCISRIAPAVLGRSSFSNVVFREV